MIRSDNQIFRLEKRRYFLVGMRAYQSADNRTTTGTGHDVGQQAFLPERLRDPDMKIKIGAGTAHQKRRPPITMLRPAEKIELLLKRNVGNLVASQIFQ